MRITDLEAFVYDSSNWTPLSTGNYNSVLISKEPLELAGHDFVGKWVIKIPLATIKDEEYARERANQARLRARKSVAQRTEEALEEEHEASQEAKSGGDSTAPDEFDLATQGMLDPEVESTERMLSLANRAVRKWNELNPSYPAILINNQYWMAPYLGSEAATDEQIAAKVLEIFISRRTIVVDLLGSGNCVVFNGEVCCIDVDLALQRGSIATDLYLAGKPDYLPTIYDLESYWSACILCNKGLSSRIVRALFYLTEKIEHDLIEPSFLTQGVLYLLYAYLNNDADFSLETLRFLSEVDQARPRLLDKCLWLLDRVEKPEVIHALCLLCLEHGELNPEEQVLYRGHIERVSARLNRPGSMSFTLLQVAVFFERNEVLSMLIEMGADVNERLPTLETAFDRLTPLEIAEVRDNETAVRALFSANPKLPSLKPNAHHYLHIAARYGLTEALRHIVENVSLVPVHTPRTEGSLKLFGAAEAPVPTSSEVTIVNVCDHQGRTALDYALLYGHPETAQYLHDLGGVARTVVAADEELRAQGVDPQCT